MIGRLFHGRTILTNVEHHGGEIFLPSSFRVGINRKQKYLSRAHYMTNICAITYHVPIVYRKHGMHAITRLCHLSKNAACCCHRFRFLCFPGEKSKEKAKLSPRGTNTKKRAPSRSLLFYFAIKACAVRS